MRMLNRDFKLTCVLVLAGICWSAAGYAQETGPSYTVEDISMPPGLTSETGAIEFLPDGRLVACFTRGEVMTYEPATKTWKLFAEGFHDPLGILVISNSELLIMQRPELTRIKDTDGDGRADVYEKVTDDFGISGNYHEFNYGPVKDKKGNIFIALNSSSPGGSVRSEIRGALDTLGRAGVSGERQMFSVVPYRGWVMKLTPKGALLPYASGFRSPNGMVLDSEDNLFVTDNQGDWIPTSALHRVREGQFHGHPASLIWKKGWDQGNPLRIPETTLDSMRTKPVILFPHGIMANSPTQPVFDNTSGKFGPFTGQMLVGEMNRGRIVRVALEQVGGEYQGASMPFIDNSGLRKGNNRLAFAPDGSLWVGQNSHGWLGDNGIQRIVFTGKQPAEVYSMKLTAKGFDLTFTQPLDKSLALNPDNYKFRHYHYDYHKKYGSDQFDIQSIPVTDIKVSEDGTQVSLTLNTLKSGYVYELTLGDIKASNGTAIGNKLICYTLNKLLTAADKPKKKHHSK